MPPSGNKTFTLQSLLYAPADVEFPPNAEAYAHYQLLLMSYFFVRDFGVTFNPAWPQKRKSRQTWAQLYGQHGNSWNDYMIDAVSHFDINCDGNHGYALIYFRRGMGLPGVSNSFPPGFPEYVGGSVGINDLIGCDTPDNKPRCGYDWHYKPWAMCGYSWAQCEALGYDVPWWDESNADPKNACAGGHCHEFGHYIVDHSHLDEPQDERGYYELTLGYSNVPNVYFAEPAFTDILESGYLHAPENVTNNHAPVYNVVRVKQTT